MESSELHYTKNVVLITGIVPVARKYACIVNMHRKILDGCLDCHRSGRATEEPVCEPVRNSSDVIVGFLFQVVINMIVYVELYGIELVPDQRFDHAN